MEIKKSYELYQVGKDIVLKRMSKLDYEMKVTFVADELVTKDVPNELASHPFFVLRKGKNFVLCWDKGEGLQVVHQCTDFRVFADTVLLKKENCWYWWISAADENQLQALGTDLKLFGKAFILPDKNAYLLMYFEDGTNLKCKRCLSYEVLVKKPSANGFLQEEFFPDVLKLVTAEEGTLYVSIRTKQGAVYHHMHGTTGGKPKYYFEFSLKPALQLIEFTKFANETSEALAQRGFSVTVATPGKAFDYASMQQKMSKDVKMHIGAALLQMLGVDVSIEVNLSRLYRKEKKPYLVKCETVGYYKEADEVRLEKTKAEHALFIVSDGVTDKIYCKGGYPLSVNSLLVMTRIR